MHYSNAVLKEDMYVFEGQQLNQLYDLLEEYKFALCNNSELENSLTGSYTEQVRTYNNTVKACVLVILLPWLLLHIGK